MKRFAGLVCALTAATVLGASCSKDKESGSLSFDSPAAYFQPGEQLTVGFSSSHVKGYSVTSKPEGWDDYTINAQAKTITITAPREFDDETVKSGSLILSATGGSASATLFVGVVDTEDMSAERANSYLVNRKQTNYLFDAMHKGDGVSSLATASVDVVWQSKSGLIQYLQLKDGKVSFYMDADDDEDRIEEGNAVIGAYDARGALIWSWHIWAADYDPESDGGKVELGNYTMMNRNLGALADNNSTTADILASYGLYYQWGRKDPFIGPSTYNAAKGESAAMYFGSGSRAYLKTAASSAETGTMEYAVQNPLTFITGVSGSENDWLWSAHSGDLWSETKKTVNDPCPYGWRVAPSAAFDGLSIVNTPAESDADKFGWTLGRNGAESLFIGAGRRRYDNGTILNIYNPAPRVRGADEAQPWEGLYWSAGTQSGTQSSALHFWFEKKNTTGGVENRVPFARANGMSVRCVKAQ